MAQIIDMPKLSDTMTMGTLVKWLKQEGDAVSSGTMLAEVETDKATMEFECFFDGTLLKIFCPCRLPGRRRNPALRGRASPAKRSNAPAPKPPRLPPPRQAAAAPASAPAEAPSAPEAKPAPAKSAPAAPLQPRPKRRKPHLAGA